MGAEDPYRWAAELRRQGLTAEQALRTMVAEGVEASLASEILASLERNRPRFSSLRVGFGTLLLLAGGAAVVLGHLESAAVLLVGGLFAVVDGTRGKR